MADDITVKDAADATVTVAGDSIGGKLFQRVKLIHGADGTNDGDVSSANGLPVTVTGTVTVGSHAVTNAGTFAVQAAQSGTWNITNVSGTVSLPTGAATAAKQPALGTAGSASADVITIQGIASGTVVPVSDGGGSLTVDGTVSIGEQPIAVTVTGQPIYGEDDPSGNGQNGYAILATRKATPANTSGADGDYEFFQMSAGRLWTSATIDAALPAGTNVIGHVIVDSGTITTVSTLTTITNAVLVKGGTAADAALANAPVTIGGRATNTNLAEMSADGDVVDATFTMQGALVTAHAPRELLGNQQTQLSNTTTETTIITAASSVFNDLYGLILANTGASATKVSIRDDTAGTVRAIVYVPVGETRGFMLPAASTMSQTATNKNWTAQCGTATTSLEVTALFVKRK